jgi:hypothetical protein
MNIQLKDVLPKLKSLLYELKRYTVMIFILILVLIYGFLAFKIGSISQTEPNEADVAGQLEGTKQLQVDQDAIDKIQQLKDQNIAVQTLFESARDNPFQEN